MSQFAWLLLGFGLFSYRLRELLICWLYFIGMFVALALLVTGGMLVWYGGKVRFLLGSPFGTNGTPVLPSGLSFT